jgi:hypothetical protein
MVKLHRSSNETLTTEGILSTEDVVSTGEMVSTDATVNDSGSTKGGGSATARSRSKTEAAMLAFGLFIRNHGIEIRLDDLPDARLVGKFCNRGRSHLAAPESVPKSLDSQIETRALAVACAGGMPVAEQVDDRLGWIVDANGHTLDFMGLNAGVGHLGSEAHDLNKRIARAWAPIFGPDRQPDARGDCVRQFVKGKRRGQAYDRFGNELRRFGQGVVRVKFSARQLIQTAGKPGYLTFLLQPSDCRGCDAVLRELAKTHKPVPSQEVERMFRLGCMAAAHIGKGVIWVLGNVKLISELSYQAGQRSRESA